MSINIKALYKKRFSVICSIILMLALIVSVIHIGIVSANDTSIDQNGFEGGTAGDYIRSVQTTSWGQEKNYSAEITEEQFAEGSTSLKLTTQAGAAKGQIVYLQPSKFLTTAGKWMNFKVYVPSDSGTEMVRLFYRKTPSNQLIYSDYYYFADNTESPVETDEIRATDEWVNLSLLVPAGTAISDIGINLTSFDASNDEVVIYIDSYSVTDVALDTIRYMDLNDPAVRSSFETGTKEDYIQAVQTNTWGQEKNYGVAVTDEQAADGKKSLRITTTAGAAKAQYFYLKSDFFIPENEKWYNLKVFVPENAETEIVSLFYKLKNGQIKNSDSYYFSDNPDSPVTTDEIRQKGEWVNLSLSIPRNADINSIGIYVTTFDDSNDNTLIYIDSYSVTDEALDTIRYLDLNDPAVRSSFETGTKEDYIQAVQTNTWGQENAYTANIVGAQADSGKKSLRITTTAGAAKAQYFYLKSDFFMPETGKWYNIKVFVPSDSKTEAVAVFYKLKNGQIKNSDIYYFADNPNKPVETDEIRKTDEWVTMSLLVPAGSELNSVGIYLTTFDDSNDEAVIYIDSYTVTDEALDTIRYMDLNDPAVRSSFESGTVSDYIAQVQTQSWGQEKNYSAALTTEQAADGKRSLRFSTAEGAAQAQYIFLKQDFFKFQPGEWFNIKLYVTPDSGPAIVRLFYKDASGPIKTSENYYFEDNPANRVMTDEIRNKGEWVTISMQIPTNAKFVSCGINITGFGESNDNCRFYIDSFSVTDKPADMIRYGAASDPNGDMLIDFESGSSVDYAYVIQNQKWTAPKGNVSAVTSYRAADGKRSLYFKNDLEENSRILYYFPLKYNPKEGSFLNVKVYVEEGNKGLDFVQLMYLQNGGQIKAGPIYSFEKNSEGVYARDVKYEKGKWITLSMYVPRGADLNRAGIQFGSYSDKEGKVINGSNKEIYIDSYSCTAEPLDTTLDYLIKPLIEIPESFSGSLNRVNASHSTVYAGISIETGENVKTNKGTIAAEDLALNTEVVTEGDIFDKVTSNTTLAHVLYKFTLTSKEQPVTLQEKIKFRVMVPAGINEATAKAYFVDEQGNITDLGSVVEFESVVFETDKIGYLLISGEKSDEAVLTYQATKVIKVKTQENTFPWLIVIIAAAAVVVIGTAAAVVIVIAKKKKAKQQ